MVTGESGCYRCPIGTYNDGSKLTCQPCGPYMKTSDVGGALSCSYFSNYVNFRGKYYAALADLPVSSYGVYSQVSSYYLPGNMTIAPNEPDTFKIISQYYWSASYMVVADGCAFQTNIYTSLYGYYPSCQNNFLETFARH